jgi:hypothetical protein
MDLGSIKWAMRTATNDQDRHSGRLVEAAARRRTNSLCGTDSQSQAEHSRIRRGGNPLHTQAVRTLRREHRSAVLDEWDQVSELQCCQLAKATPETALVCPHPLPPRTATCCDAMEPPASAIVGDIPSSDDRRKEAVPSALLHLSFRWNGKLFDLQIDQADLVLDLKSAIFSLTNIPPERQKVLGLIAKKFARLPWSLGI